MAGAPQGNQNAKKSKPWGDAIRRAIARYDSIAQEDGKFLNALADQLLKDCLNGEKPAIDELTNRLDGKYPQPISGDDENPLTIIQKIERTIVRPDNTNG